MRHTRHMSDAHEQHLAEVLGGRVAKGSGNQWHDQMDGRNSSLHEEFAFAWDGKSTYSASVGVSIPMWEKARLQTGRERPCLALRFYSDQRGSVRYDLIVSSLADFSEMKDEANMLARIREQGCLEGSHDFPGESTCTVCGVDAYNLPGAES